MDETDCISEQNLPLFACIASWDVQTARRRIERRKQLVGDVDFGISQGIEERRFPRIRIPDHRHRWDIVMLALLAQPRAVSLELVDILLESRNPLLNRPALGF